MEVYGDIDPDPIDNDGEEWGKSDELHHGYPQYYPGPNIDFITVQSYRLLSTTQIEHRRRDAIARIADALAIDADLAESLLGEYRWRSSALQDAFLHDRVPLIHDRRDRSPSTALVSCGSAFCGEHDRGDCIALSCGHLFCHGCWRALVRSAMSRGRFSVYTQCPGADIPNDGRLVKCHLQVPMTLLSPSAPGEMAIQSLATTANRSLCVRHQVPSSIFFRFLDAASALKYKQWMIDGFIDCSRTLRWCNRPSCVTIAECSNPKQVITCSCRSVYCFGCGLDDHRPAPCDLVRKWLDRTSSDSETDLWITSRTKQCPKCKIRIEKNRACNHMVCSNCSFHFCWLCKEAWSEHDVEKYGFYRCNVFEANPGKVLDDDAAVAAANATHHMQKYTFYYNRHIHQRQAETEMTKLYQRLERGTPIGRYVDRWAVHDLDKVLSIVEQLIGVRRHLGWTFCLSYYMRSDLTKRLLEHQQGVLESLAEKLQAAIVSSDANDDQESGDDGGHDRVQEMIRLAAAVHHFSCELLRRCADGDDIELLNQADDGQDAWACTICTSELRNDQHWCTSCGACRRHSEQECRVPDCRNPLTPAHPQPDQGMAPPPPPPQQHQRYLLRRLPNLIRD